MLGLLVIGLTLFMIYTLVKNALFGKQVSSSDQFSGSIDLILPIEKTTQFYLPQWERALTVLRGTSLRIHVLIDGHHSEMHHWNELARNHSFVEVHSFLTRPENIKVAPWMIQQIAHRIQGDVVIIGDASLLPSEGLFSSVAKLVKEKDRPYFTLPQTVRKNVLCEALALLNPTLAFTSLYGTRKLRRNLSHPFLALSDGWLAMPVNVFKELPLEVTKTEAWRLSFVQAIESKKIKVYLAFAEKHLLRNHPKSFEDAMTEMKNYWPQLWSMNDRQPFWFFVTVLCVWSFPLICLFSHPFWALASLCLLVLYRFFTKIVFQESWLAAILHPVACVLWLATLFMWLGTSARSLRRAGT